MANNDHEDLVAEVASSSDEPPIALLAALPAAELVARVTAFCERQQALGEAGVEETALRRAAHVRALEEALAERAHGQGHDAVAGNETITRLPTELGEALQIVQFSLGHLYAAARDPSDGIRVADNWLEEYRRNAYPELCTYEQLPLGTARFVHTLVCISYLVQNDVNATCKH
jgi:hypothetical protein